MEEALLSKPEKGVFSSSIHPYELLAYECASSQLQD
jgi:hypothetical protein